MPFPYFGRKARIANLYPPARFDTIVEPFAGSASYALHADHWTEVHKTKGWELIEGDYSLAPDVEATWFIDPPYQHVTYGYRAARRALNFAELAEWCQARRGQTIVCEEDSADWLPFTPLTATTTLNNTPTVEVWWSNEKVTLF